MSMRPVHWNGVTVALSTFSGAVIGVLQTKFTDLETPPTVVQVKAAVMGALLAGLVAVYHLYQPSPAQRMPEEGPYRTASLPANPPPPESPKGEAP
jgi:hypothetical protein